MTMINNMQPRALSPWEQSGKEQLGTSKWHQDVYNIIFSIIASTDTPLRSIVAFGSVSRGFRLLCLIHFPASRMMHALSCIYKSMPVALEPSTSPFPHTEQRLLAVDASENSLYSGNQYYCSKHGNYQSVLYIINPLHKRLITLDMDKQNLVDETKVELKIVDCHPIEQGFILVCNVGVSEWHFTKDSPEPTLAWYRGLRGPDFGSIWSS